MNTVHWPPSLRKPGQGCTSAGPNRTGDPGSRIRRLTNRPPSQSQGLGSTTWSAFWTNSTNSSGCSESPGQGSANKRMGSTGPSLRNRSQGWFRCSHGAPGEQPRTGPIRTTGWPEAGKEPDKRPSHSMQTTESDSHARRAGCPPTWALAAVRDTGSAAPTSRHSRRPGPRGRTRSNVAEWWTSDLSPSPQTGSPVALNGDSPTDHGFRLGGAPHPLGSRRKTGRPPPSKSDSE